MVILSRSSCRAQGSDGSSKESEHRKSLHYEIQLEKGVESGDLDVMPMPMPKPSLYSNGNLIPWNDCNGSTVYTLLLYASLM